MYEQEKLIQGEARPKEILCFGILLLQKGLIAHHNWCNSNVSKTPLVEHYGVKPTIGSNLLHKLLHFQIPVVPSLGARSKRLTHTTACERTRTEGWRHNQRKIVSRAGFNRIRSWSYVACMNTVLWLGCPQHKPNVNNQQNRKVLRNKSDNLHCILNSLFMPKLRICF